MSDWPELPYESWCETKQTLQLYLQVVGKLRLALSPPEPQWNNVPLYLTARGLTTSPLPHPAGIFDVEVDFTDQHVRIRTAAGVVEAVRLEPRSVADFYTVFLAALDRAGVPTEISPQATEVPDPIPYPEDRVHASYDAEWAGRFHQVLLRVDAVLKEHRGRFPGRTSPVNFWWGSCDLAYTRYSGKRLAPPADAGTIARGSHDAEQWCAGFWPGDDRHPSPAFFGYTWPAPAGEGGEHWDARLGEFVLEYDAVRTAPDPRQALLDFLDATFRVDAAWA